MEKSINVEDKSISRLHAGVFSEYKLLKELGLGLALLYSEQGVERKYEPTHAIEKILIHLDYIVLAPTLRIYLTEERQFCLFTGPQVGYRLFASWQKLCIIDCFKSKTNNLKQSGELIQNFDIGIITGLDHEFTSGLSLGFAFSFGLVDVFKEESTTNSVGHLSLGYNLVKLMQ